VLKERGAGERRERAAHHRSGRHACAPGVSAAACIARAATDATVCSRARAGGTGKEPLRQSPPCTEPSAPDGPFVRDSIARRFPTRCSRRAVRPREGGVSPGGRAQAGTVPSWRIAARSSRRDRRAAARAPGEDLRALEGEAVRACRGHAVAARRRHES
jgi:hypothetical protein